MDSKIKFFEKWNLFYYVVHNTLSILKYEKDSKFTFFTNWSPSDRLEIPFWVKIALVYLQK